MLTGVASLDGIRGCSLKLCSNVVCWSGAARGHGCNDGLLLTLNQQLVMVFSELTLLMHLLYFYLPRGEMPIRHHLQSVQSTPPREGMRLGFSWYCKTVPSHSVHWRM